MLAAPHETAPSTPAIRWAVATRIAFRFSCADQRTSEDRLVLDGRLDGRTICAELTRVGPGSFRLVKSGFRRVEEYPFIR